MTRPNAMSMLTLAIGLFFFAPNWSHAAPLKSVDAVLDQYKQVLGGADSIAKVQSVTISGEIDGSGLAAKASFVSFAKPFKTLFKVTRADGSEVTSGFDAVCASSARVFRQAGA
jgi:hypothetical protein